MQISKVLATAPDGTEDYVGAFTLPSAGVFTLANLKPEQAYTLSLWVKSNASASISIGSVLADISTEWSRADLSFIALSESVDVAFSAGDYQTYKWKLEKGTEATEWTNSTCDGMYLGRIVSDAICTGAIVADKIATDAITATKIKAGAIETDKIAANAITTAKIAAGAVKANSIDAGAITTEKIEAGAVKADSIAADAITTDKIVADAITANEIAAKAITANEIAANAITTDKIEAGAVKANSIDAGAITSTKIASNAITADKVDVADLFAQDITATNFHITGGSVEIDTSFDTDDHISFAYKDTGARNINTTDMNSDGFSFSKRSTNSLPTASGRLYTCRKSSIDESGISSVSGNVIDGVFNQKTSATFKLNCDITYTAGDLANPRWDSNIPIKFTGNSGRVMSENEYAVTGGEVYSSLMKQSSFSFLSGDFTVNESSCYKRCGIAFVDFAITFTTSSNATYSLGTIPTGYRPLTPVHEAVNLFAPNAACPTGNYTSDLFINTNGVVTLYLPGTVTASSALKAHVVYDVA